MTNLLGNRPTIVSRVHRQIEGGAGSLLVTCDDGGLYVLKCPWNKQGPNVLANEHIASKLMEHLGLPVPRSTIVRCAVYQCCKRFQPSLQDGGYVHHFASSWLPSVRKVPSSPTITEKSFRQIVNQDKLVGAFIFDLWCGAQDARQFVVTQCIDSDDLSLTFIDHGHCFGGPSWSFANSQGRCLTHNHLLYQRLIDSETIHYWTQKLLQTIPAVLGEVITAVPESWYEGDIKALHFWLSGRLDCLESLVISELRAMMMLKHANGTVMDSEGGMTRAIIGMPTKSTSSATSTRTAATAAKPEAKIDLPKVQGELVSICAKIKAATAKHTTSSLNVELPLMP